MNRHLMATRSSHLSSVRRCCVCIMLLAAPLLLASSAYADLISIGFQEAGVNAGAITTVATGSGAVSVGPIPYGTFNVNDVSAIDFADLGPPGLLNTNVQDISTAKVGVLTIWVTAQGVSAPTGPVNFHSTFAVNTLSGGVVQVQTTTYFSPTNALYTGTMLDSQIFTDVGTGKFNQGGVTVAPYSVTEKYQIFDLPGVVGSDNLTIDLSAAVPEPASLGLIGAGLLGIFALKSRR